MQKLTVLRSKSTIYSKTTHHNLVNKEDKKGGTPEMTKGSGQSVVNMEDHRRTRSQGPLSLPDREELIQWESLPDPSRIEREQGEALRLARRVNTATNIA